MRRQEYWWRLFSEITLNMSIRASLRSAGPLLVTLLAPGVSLAQDTPLSSILPDLLGNTITLLPSNLPDQPNHVAHFRPGFDQLQVPTQVNQALADAAFDLPARVAIGRVHLHLRPGARDADPKQRQLRPVIRRARADDGAWQSRRGFHLPARDVRHVRGSQPPARGDEVLRAAHRLLQPRHRRISRCRMAHVSPLRSKAI